MNAPLSLLFNTKFSSVPSSKIVLIAKKKKKTDENPFIVISVVYFLWASLFTEKCSQPIIIHLGIFGGRELYSDSVSLWMNTIASCDQFKPIRIGENLVVNYNGLQFQSVNQSDCSICISILVEFLSVIDRRWCSNVVTGTEKWHAR